MPPDVGEIVCVTLASLEQRPTLGLLAFTPLGRVSPLSEHDFMLLIASMLATTSVALGAAVGRGAVGDVEVTVMRADATRRSASVH